MASRSGDGSYSNGTGTKENIRYLEEALVRFDKRLDGIDQKLSYIGRANWQVILSTVGVSLLVVGGLWGLTVAPINSEVGRLDSGLSSIYVVAGTRGIQLAEHGVKLDNINNNVEMLRGRIQKYSDEHVPYKEFNATLGVTIATRVEMQRQLDALIKKVDDVFPPQKTLEDLTRRLAELERTRNTVIQAPAGVLLKN